MSCVLSNSNGNLIPAISFCLASCRSHGKAVGVFRALIAAIAVFPTNSKSLWGQDSIKQIEKAPVVLTEPETVIELLVQGEFKDNESSPPTVGANIVIGWLTPNADYRIGLTLQNRLGRDLTFNNVVSSCSCSVMSEPLHSIPDGQDEPFEISFRSPPSRINAMVPLGFSFVDSDGKTVAVINLIGKLAGNLKIDH